MNILPDWDSIQSTERWSDVLFWTGIVCLVLLAATEVASHIYGRRAGELRSEATRVADEQRQQDANDAERRRKAEVGALEKQLSEADKKTAELEKQQTPRRLTPEQKQTLIATLSPHAGQKIIFVTILGDNEAKRFMEDFIEVIDAAKWDHSGDNGILYMNFGNANDPVGVIVVLNDQSRVMKRGPAAVLPLTEALAAFGLAKAHDVTPTNDIKLGEIGLVIGRKPRAGDVEKWKGVPLQP